MKNDLKASLLVDPCSLSGLQALSDVLGQLVLSKWIGDWLNATQFLKNLIVLLLTPSSPDYKTLFVRVADVILTLLRSRGALDFFVDCTEATQALALALEGLATGAEDGGELSLIEEEYLLAIITAEKLPAYAGQLSFLLQQLNSLGTILELQDACTQYTALYAWLNGVSPLFPGVCKDLFYAHAKTHPERVHQMTCQIDLKEPQGMLISFYVLEIIFGLLELDRSGEFMMLAGPEILKVLDQQEEQALPEQFEMVNLIKDWLAPIRTLEKAPKVAALVAELAEYGKSDSEATFFKAQGVHLLAKNAAGDPVEGHVLPLVRLMNAMISVNKWSSLELLHCGGVTILTNLIGRAACALHSLLVKYYEEKVFQIESKGALRNSLLEQLISSINIFNILMQQFLGTNLLCYNNSALLESILVVAALSEYISDKQNNRTLQKLNKVIRTLFTLWAQQPNFVDVYFPIMAQHCFQYPYQRLGVLNMISGVLEHFVSYKDPGFWKCMNYLVKAVPPPLFMPELIYFYLMRAKKVEEEQSILKIFYMPFEEVIEHKSSRYAARQNWEFKRMPSLNHHTAVPVLQALVLSFGVSDSREVHLAVVRLVRCVLAMAHYQGTMIICSACVELIRAKGPNTGKGLLLVQAILEFPVGKAMLLHLNVLECFLPLYFDNELSVSALKITRKLLDVSTGLSEDLNQRLVEELPSPAQVLTLLLEFRKLCTFSVPGLSRAISHDEDDALFRDFERTKLEQTTCSWVTTYWVIVCLKELSSTFYGRSLVVWGEYPPSDELSLLFDFEDLFHRILTGLYVPEMTENMLEMLEMVVEFLANLGPDSVSEATVEETLMKLRDFPSEKTQLIEQRLEALQSPQVPPIVELPQPRDLSAFYAEESPDFAKTKEHYKGSRRNHMQQIVENKRLGEKLQLKAVQALTDLQPPPYPPIFKLRTEVSLTEWEHVVEPNQDFTAELAHEKFKQKEEVKAPQYERHDAALFLPEQLQAVPSRLPYQHTPIAYPPLPLLSGAEHLAMQELLQLLEKSDQNHDPRVRTRIEQLLRTYPALANLAQTNTEG